MNYSINLKRKNIWISSIITRT